MKYSFWKAVKSQYSFKRFVHGLGAPIWITSAITLAYVVFGDLTRVVEGVETSVTIFQDTLIFLGFYVLLWTILLGFIAVSYQILKFIVTSVLMYGLVHYANKGETQAQCYLKELQFDK